MTEIELRLREQADYVEHLKRKLHEENAVYERLLHLQARADHLRKQSK